MEDPRYTRISSNTNSFIFGEIQRCVFRCIVTIRNNNNRILDRTSFRNYDDALEYVQQEIGWTK